VTDVPEATLTGVQLSNTRQPAAINAPMPARNTVKSMLFR